MKKAYFVIAIIIISLLTIGFSAFENSLLVDDIAVEVRVKKDIRVTEITSATGNNGGVVGTYDYNVNNINGTITLPNSNSSVTYQVKVTNIGNTDMGILTVNDLPSNLDYEITGYTEGEKLCNGSNVCSGGIDKTFNITIKYKNETTTNEPMDFITTFDFRGFHNINYNNSVVGEVIDGGNKVVNLGNNAPDEITITGTYLNQSYTKPNLTLEGVTSDINIEASSSGGGGTGTPEDPYVNNEDTYDPSNVQEGTTIYNNVEGKPKVTANEDGKVTSFEFTSNEPVTIGDDENNSGTNTGFIPFESGKNWELRLRALFPINPNKDKNSIILAIRDETKASDNNADYIQAAYYSKKSPPQLTSVYHNADKKRVYVSKPISFNDDEIIDITIVYYDGKITLTNNITNTVLINSVTASYNMQNKTVLLGYDLKSDGTLNTNRTATATVYNFYVKEI